MPASACQTSPSKENLGRPVFDDGRLETKPRQRVVDRARHLQPAHWDGLREDLRYRDLARPALDIEEGTAEDAVGRKIERQGAGKRNPHAGKLLELRDDGGELRGIQGSEFDCSAAHPACPVMEQLHVEAGLDILHPEIERQVADDGGLVQIQGDVGIGGRPCEAGALVVESKSGIAQADTLQPAHRVILAGRVEQVGHQRIGRSIVGAAAIVASGESKLPLGVADEAEAEPDQLDRGGRDNAPQQGRAAQPERRRGHLRYGLAACVRDAHVGHLDLKRTIPAGPDEDGVVELDPIVEIVVPEGFLDVGREEFERDRPARQPPGPEGEENRERAEQGAERMESDAGRRSHVDWLETAAPAVPARPL